MTNITHGTASGVRAEPTIRSGISGKKVKGEKENELT